MSPKPEDDMIGKVLGDYKIQRLLGKGGMSYVYQASDQQLGRDVAIKLITLHRDRAKELMKRFRKEARVLSRLDTHPNIVTIYRYGTEDEDTHYLAMELIRGETLTQRLSRHRRKKTYMPSQEIIHIIRQIAAALDFAHQNNVIHRDIKPSNIMIEKSTERAVLMDFGLVMDAGTQSTLGTAFGTPRYISPEQAISSQQAVFQSDIYSLAVIVYETIAGQTPFDEDSAMSLALSHITNPPPPLRQFRPEVSDAVAAVVMKALEKQPEDRHASATEFINALAEAYEREPFEEDSALSAVGSDSEENTDTPDREKARIAAAVSPIVMPKASTPPPPAVRATPPPAAKPAPPVAEIKSAEAEEKKKSRWPLILVALLGGIILVSIVAFVALGGDDDSGQNGDENGNTTRNGGSDGDIVLLYNSDHLTIYNASDHVQDLTGIQLWLPNRQSNFDTYFIGVDTIKALAPQNCIHVTYDRSGSVENDVNPPEPEVCGSNTINKEHLTKQQQSYFWVWDSSTSDFSAFDVTLNTPDNILKTCELRDRECSFSLPQS